MKKFFQLSMAIALGAMMAACSSPVEPSTTGDFVSSRKQIYELQPTTFACQYIPSSDVDTQKTTCTYEVTPAPAVTMPQFTSRIAGQEAYCYNYALAEGTYKLTMNINEVMKDGSKNIISKNIEFSVSGQQPDIRNSFWGSSKADCLQDIHYYYTDGAPEDVGTHILFEEDDAYYDNYEYQAGSKPALGTADREVAYTLDDKNALCKVSYFIYPKKMGINLLVEDMFNHQFYISAENSSYYGFSNFEYSAPIKKDMTLTPEEEALRQKFLAGDPRCDDEEGTLVKAVQADKLTLYINGSNDKSTASIQLYHNSKGTMEPHFAIFFEPKK